MEDISNTQMPSQEPTELTEPTEPVEPIPENIPERKKTEKRVIIEEDEIDKQAPIPEKTKKKKKKIAGICLISRPNLAYFLTAENPIVENYSIKLFQIDLVINPPPLIDHPLPLELVRQCSLSLSLFHLLSIVNTLVTRCLLDTDKVKEMKRTTDLSMVT